MVWQVLYLSVQSQYIEGTSPNSPMKRKLQENPNTMYQDSFLTTQTTSEWSRKDNKAFEEGLVMLAEELPDRWQRISNQVGKSMREVMEHYEALVHDVCEIDSGRVEVPSYVDEWGWDNKGTCQISFGSGKCNNNCGGDAERKKGTPWTEEEHKKFLIGLSKFGKGDWRSISRNVVVTRTPTQVASHAQKYSIRQNSAVKKERKRSSIHDITTVDNNAALPVDESPILLLEEPVQPPTIQALPHSRYFPILDGLIPSNNVHNQEQGRLFGYPNFSFPI